MLESRLLGISELGIKFSLGRYDLQCQLYFQVHCLEIFKSIRAGEPDVGTVESNIS